MTRAPFPGSPLTGSNLMTGLNTRFKELYDAAAFPLTSIGGTANAVTATLDPALDGDGLVVGMGFTLTWGAENTAGVTLAINGGTAFSVLNADGSALAAGSVGSGLRSLITWAGGAFRIMSPTLLMGGSSGVRFQWTFTASGTWTKPTDLPGDTPVYIQGWGAGGGGSSNTGGGGGGGGAYIDRIIRADALGPTVTATIGAGGATNAAGGNTTFGAFLTAYGGGGGLNTATSQGGGGGGTNEAGTAPFAGSPGAGGYWGGGNGGAIEASGQNADLYGGGGGAGGESPVTTPYAGGRSVFGGGGGGAGNAGLGGVSLYGGNGGNAGSAGQAPGGGGGKQASGARGELRIWI